MAKDAGAGGRLLIAMEVRFVMSKPALAIFAGEIIAYRSRCYSRPRVRRLKASCLTSRAERPVIPLIEMDKTVSGMVVTRTCFSQVRVVFIDKYMLFPY
jgi:hypothetical protein